MGYECEDCDKVYKKKDGLRAHIKIKHSKNQSLQCDKCYKYFLNKYKLKDHVRGVHPSKLHSCTFCGSSFKASWIKFKFFVSI
jgi:hypothetical protein